MSTFSIKIKPKVTTRRLLNILPERSKDVIVRRFGLGDSPEQMTLEAIGDDYGITRERVRQIENNALDAIRNSDVFVNEEEIFSSVKKILDELGVLIGEEILLSNFSKDTHIQNNMYFLLTLGSDFVREKENDHFVHRWHTDQNHADSVYRALHDISSGIGDNDLIPDKEILVIFHDKLKGHEIDETYYREDTMRRWLALSKIIGKNPLGEWGLASSPNIKVKGIRDYAYLALRVHGSPMHFMEISKAIERQFGRKAHIATCHNELIKDPRFVLVGRGLYALVEWGYMGGVVRDVILEILKKHGPLTRKEVVDKVLRERYVKENTIAVNLEDDRHFSKDHQGRYIPK